MASPNVVSVADAGSNPTYVAVSSSDTFAFPAGKDFVILHVKNGGGSPDTVGVTSRAIAPDGTAATNKSVSVPAGEDRFIRVSKSAFENSADGLVTVTHSFTTSVTAAVLHV